MDVRTLNDLCMKIKQKDSLSSFRIIRKRLKQNKIDSLFNQIYNSDIYEVSNVIQVFICSLLKNSPNCLDDVSNFVINKSIMKVFLDNNSIFFIPKDNSFLVTVDKQPKIYSFYVYKDIPNTKTIESLWEPMEIELRKFYEKLIYRISEEL